MPACQRAEAERGWQGTQEEEGVVQKLGIPKENLLGEEGKGFKFALGSLDETRTSLSAGFVDWQGLPSKNL